MKFDIFISYSRKDFDEVSSVLETLKAAIPGLTYWFDIDGIESGDEFEDKIISAIDRSAYVLFALSENSISSVWTKDEVMYAKNTGKKVIPLMLEGAEMKGWFLFKFGRVDCIDSTNALQMEKLVQNLSSWVGKACVSADPALPEEPTLPSTSSQHKGSNEPLCPCGSGKLFKDCHGKTDTVQTQVAPQVPLEAPVEAPVETPANEPEVVPVVVPSDTPRSRNWEVGDYYNADGKEGVVFWVDGTGRFIKIVHLDHAKLEWCKYEERKVVTGAVDRHDGMKNLEIISRIPDWKSKYPAFAWCVEQGDGWYMPALEEFKGIVALLDKVNHTLKQRGGKIMNPGMISKWLWSSTEAEKNYEVNVFTDSFSVFNGYKSNTNYVRAVALIDTERESSTVWKVGDYYNVHGREGIVFQVDETGTHGKIVSLDECHCRWSTLKQWWKDILTDAADEHDGMKNQQRIMAIADWHVKYPAFAWCSQHGPEWYLPAIEELKDLLLNPKVYSMVNETLSRMKYKKINSGSDVPWTWSSTEFKCGHAFYITTIGEGRTDNTITESKCYVRAVSTF